MTATPTTTKIRAGLYRLDLVIASTETVATFDLALDSIGDDGRMRWMVTAEDAEGRTVVEYGDGGEYRTKRDALASAVRFSEQLVPHPQYGWVVDPAR